MNSPIRVQDESDVLHLAVGESLLERHSKFFEPCTGSFNVRNRDRNVSKSTSGVRISRAVASERRVRLGTMIVCELEDT